MSSLPDANHNIKKNLKKLRSMNKLSMREVAAILGVKENTYRVWEDEQNKTVPKTDMLLQLAKVFDVSVDFLFRDELTNLDAVDNRLSNRNGGTYIYGDKYISELSSEEKVTVMKIRRMSTEDKQKVYKLIDLINKKIDDEK